MKTAGLAAALVGAAMVGAVGATMLAPAKAPEATGGTGGPGAGAVAANSGARDAGASPSPSPAPAQPAPRPTVAAGPPPAALVDMAPNAEEMEFLRSALAKERARREASVLRPEDGGLDTLDRVFKQQGDARGILWDWGSVRSRVRTGEGERRTFASAGGDGPTPVSLGELAGKDAVLEFGPGRFVVARDKGRFGDIRNDLRYLEIRGAGKDVTILEAGDGGDLIQVGEAKLENLLVKDLTFDGGSRRNGLLDIRGGASVAIENVRFVNIPSGGHGAPVGISGSIFLGMKGCEFLGTGNFGVSVRGGALALLQECRFQGLEATVIGNSGTEAATVVNLLDCVFDGSSVADSRVLRSSKKAPAFVIGVRGGRVSFGPPDMKDEERRGKWGLPYVSECEGTAFGPEKPSCTLGHLLAVLDGLRLPADEPVVRVAVYEAGVQGPARYQVSTLNRGNGQSRHYFCGPEGAGVSELPASWGKPWTPPVEETEGALPLAQALRQSGLPEGTAASTVEFGRATKVNDESVPTIQLWAPRAWQNFVLNARTGADLIPRR